MPSSSRPLLTLVVASRNEGERLKNTLASALDIQQPGQGLEISVVDDASTDGSSTFLDQEPWLSMRSRSQLRLTRLADCHGISRARRIGGWGARGEILIFIDAHLEFTQPDFWLQIEERFQHSDCDLLGVDCYDSNTGNSTAGMVYTSKRLCHSTPAWSPAEPGQPLNFCKVPFVNGGFFAIRRTAYEHLEGFHDCLQGWGHEDRLLSMLASLCGYQCRSDQRLRVGHFYKESFAEPTGETAPVPYADPLQTDGIPRPNTHYAHAQKTDGPVPLLLLNSLRCATLLYDRHHFALTVEQLEFEYGHDLTRQALAVIDKEKPQLMAYLDRIGLNEEKRDQRFRQFCAEYREHLPMLSEAELQFIPKIPNQKQALERVQKLPRQLPSLAEPEASQYQCARLYREAALCRDLGEPEQAAALLGQLLQIDPNFLPAIRLLTLLLRILGRAQGERFWLLQGVKVIDNHAPAVGDEPVKAFHPASSNPYLRHMYWPAVDRELWLALAEREELDGNPSGSLPWLGRLLKQTPDDFAIREKLQTLWGLPPDAEREDTHRAA